MKRNRVHLRLILMLGVVVMAVAAAKLTTAGADAVSPAQSHAVVRVGSRSLLHRSDRVTITLPVEALAVQNVGAATVEVAYNPAQVENAGCQPNSAFDIRLCNTALDRDGDGAADAVGFTEISMDGLSAAGDEPLNLADITWTVDGGLAVGTVITLGLTVSTFTDVDGIPFSIGVQSGRITITSGMENAVFLPLTGFKFDGRHRVYLPLIRQ
jgi:hypothetical protein